MMRCTKLSTKKRIRADRCRRNALHGEMLCPRHLKEARERKVIVDAAAANYVRRERQREARAKKRVGGWGEKRPDVI